MLRPLTLFSVAAVLSATPAVAGHGRLEMDSESEAVGAGFALVTDGQVHADFAGGALTVGPGGVAALTADVSADAASTWWADVTPTRGWWVEATVSSSADDCSLDGGGAGHGLSIDDGAHLVQLSLLGESVTVLSPPGLAAASVVLRDRSHRVRVEATGAGRARVLVDDVEVIPSFEMAATFGVHALSIGKLSACAGQSVWDALEWDTYRFGTGPDDDDDGDGVVNGDDDCAEVVDPEQGDGDGDGVGDACDHCPADPANDGDGDGVCGSDDPCPDTPLLPNPDGTCPVAFDGGPCGGGACPSDFVGSGCESQTDPSLASTFSVFLVGLLLAARKRSPTRA